MARALNGLRHRAFDVVGTPIDFEGGSTDCPADIAAETEVVIDGRHERRHARDDYGGTIEPERFTAPDLNLTTMAGLAETVDCARAA